MRVSQMENNTVVPGTVTKRVPRLLVWELSGGVAAPAD
jgi:hypothetical protein